MEFISILRREGFFFVVILATFIDGRKFVAAAAASDWSQSQPEEYVMAWINLTYMDAEKLHTEKTEGKFGIGKVGPANGLVVHVTSGNDSHSGCHPYWNEVPNEPWIALVKRGACSLDEKIRNAYQSNASALVVYAKEDKDTLDKMNYKDCKNCNFPTVLTYKWKGEEIAKHVDRGTKVYMYITVGETISRPNSGINRTSVLFVSISFIVLMIISLAWLVFYYVQRFRYLHAKDRLAQRLCNAAKKALAKIPTRNIRLTDKEITSEGDCCAVCIELYRSGETLRTLPCRHEFHKSCVDPWLLEHRTCPMCKMDILKYYGFILTGSQESILHLDMEEGILNSSESREIESPAQDSHHPRRLHVVGHPLATTTATGEQHVFSIPARQESTIGSSLVSLTVISTSKGTGGRPSYDNVDSRLEKSSSFASVEGQDSVGSNATVESGEHLKPSDDLDGAPYQRDLPKSSSTDDSHHCVPVTVHQAASVGGSETTSHDSPTRSRPTERLNNTEAHQEVSGDSVP